MMVMMKVMATNETIKCSNLEKKRKRKTKTKKIKAKVYDRFLFCTQDTIKGVSDLGSIAIL